MKKQIILGTILILLIPFMLSAVVVGLNDDVHFDYDGEANDFHIEGIVHSSGGIVPQVLNILVFGDPGSGNWEVSGYQLQRIGFEDWKFTLDFKTDGYIKYCQWIHFGIKFDVKTKNIIADLIGWWTLDGKPVMKLKRSLEGGEITDQYQQVAVTGFEVAGDGSDKFFRVMNDTNLEVDVNDLQLAVSAVEIPLEDMNVYGLGRPGETSPKYKGIKWIDISEYLPGTLKPQTSVKVNLKEVGIVLDKGMFLLMRGEQLMAGTELAKINAAKRAEKKAGKSTEMTEKSDWGWFWEQHGE
ncbi:MAG: hypothetical protein GY765_31800 [bacterium]|nr:hypothetical protein [bacterium]